MTRCYPGVVEPIPDDDAVRDCLPSLREAIMEAREAGLGSEAENLERVSSYRLTSSSEVVQEHRLAMRRLADLPRKLGMTQLGVGCAVRPGERIIAEPLLLSIGNIYPSSWVPVLTCRCSRDTFSDLLARASAPGADPAGRKLRISARHCVFQNPKKLGFENNIVGFGLKKGWGPRSFTPFANC